MAETILDRIVVGVRARLEAESPAPDLEERAIESAERRRAAGDRRPFGEALGRPGRAVIAECKHASPSAGVLRERFNAVELARSYEAGGAAAISVVTEPDCFAGRLEWLEAVRAAITVPVLRKDFLVEPRQLYESALAGADAVLLIQRLLDPDRLAELLDLACRLGLEVLVELFADEDPAPAVASGCRVIGVNARDLATFEVRLDRVEAIAASLPEDRVRVAESGIRSAADLEGLAAAGYDAFLVGEHLVRAPDPCAALRDLRG